MVSELRDKQGATESGRGKQRDAGRSTKESGRRKRETRPGKKRGAIDVHNISIPTNKNFLIGTRVRDKLPKYCLGIYAVDRWLL